MYSSLTMGLAVITHNVRRGKRGKKLQIEQYISRNNYFKEHYSISFQLKGELLVTVIFHTREDELSLLESSNWSK